MEKRTKVVIDTNWYISASINKKSRRVLYNLLNDESIEIYYSYELFDEFKKVIVRSKFKKFIQIHQVNRLINLILPLLTKISVAIKVKISRDVKDDFLLELSEEAKSDFLITGDPDLLVLKNHKNTVILTMSEFLQQYK